MADYRIKKGIHPYSGRPLLATSETETTVTGWVIIGRARTATGHRTYRREELEEING